MEEKPDPDKTIATLKRQLADVTFSFKLVISVIVAICFGILQIAYQWIVLLAAVGGAEASKAFGETGSSILFASFEISQMVITISLMIFGVLLLWFVWGDEISTAFDAIPVILRGARKELKSEKEQPPEQKEKKD